MSAPPPLRDLSDARARRRAATAFDRNLVIEAGAGTGKTALLVERALNLLAGAAVPMNEIAAITFSEKAAAELRERLARGLEELRALARNGTPPAVLTPDTEACRAYLWLLSQPGADARLVERRALEALVDLDSASVSTLHAFCADILRRHPREAGVDPAFAIDEGPFFRSLFEEEWDAFLAEELGPEAPRTAVWRSALRVPGALEGVVSLGAALASFRLPREAAEPATGPRTSPRAMLGDAIGPLLLAIGDLLLRARGLNPNMEHFLNLSKLYLEGYLERGRAALADVEDEWTLADYLKKTPTPGQRLAGCSTGEVEETAARAKGLVAALSRVDEEAISDIARAAAPLARRARERLLAAGFVSFDGLLRLTRELLANDPATRHALGARHRVILVDEFQDTDPLQYEILFFLAEEEGGRAGEAHATRLAPGRLFIVGDPKQAIYRFRGADIEAYQRAVAHVKDCGGEVLALDNSFRSPDGIVGPINTLFESFIGPRATEEQPAYQPLVSARGTGAEPGARVEIWSVAAAGDAEERRQAEGNAIAAWIAANLGRPAATGRALRYKQIALLFRALSNVDIYAQSLRRSDIPFVVEGGKNFYERPEVGDLISFLRVAANPNDGAALLAVLRGPLGGVPDAELASFVAAGGRLGRSPAAEVDAARWPDLRGTLALIERFRAATRGLPPDEIIRAALRDTPLAVLHAARFEGAQRVANLLKLTARAEVLARRGLSLEETLGGIESELGDEREEGESPLADETVDAVRILSVHRAKGLEFDVVFVPDLGREGKGGRPSDTSVAWVSRNGGALAVRLSDGSTNLAWVGHALSTRRHEEAEEKRVFYVACTRARERLILVNSTRGRSAPWRDSLSALGYSAAAGFPPDAILADGDVAHRLVTPPPVPAPAPRRALDDRWCQAALRFEEVVQQAQTSVAPVRSPSGAGPAPDDASPAADLPSAARAARDVARLAGSAVHAALQGWDFGDGRRLRDLGRQAAARLLEAGDAATPERRERVGRETGEIIEEFLSSPLPGRLASLSVLGREVPILFRDEAGATWSGACDLVYRDGRGRLVIADYKTERLDAPPAVAAERHRRQMEIYREAFRRALGETTVVGEILFVRVGISVAL